MPRKRIKEITDSICKHVRISNRDKFDYDQTDLIMSELRLIDTVQECLANKYYQLHLVEDSAANVITTDRPFLLSPPKGGNGFYFGLNTPNIEICVPITRNAILIARNEKIKEGVFQASNQMVGLTNRKLIRSAFRFFYSSTESVLLIDDDLAVYNHKISANKS